MVSLGPQLIATEGKVKVRELFGQPSKTLPDGVVVDVPQDFHGGWANEGGELAKRAQDVPFQ